jgi:hypothetical protein
MQLTSLAYALQPACKYFTNHSLIAEMNGLGALVGVRQQINIASSVWQSETEG